MGTTCRERRSGLLASLVPMLALAACSRAKPPATPLTSQVTVVTVHRTNIPITIDLPGRTSAFLVAQVRARVDGIVQKRVFVEGSDVKVGQRLYQIDPAPYIAALNSAEAAVQKATATLASTTAQAERYQALVAENAVSKQEYDNAVASKGQSAADLATGRAAVEAARINLGYTSVVSPITGISGISLVTQGAYVQAASANLLTTVQQIDPIFQSPTPSGIFDYRTAFFLPEKNLLGLIVPTYTFNVLVIWMMCLVLYAALATKLPQRILGKF